MKFEAVIKDDLFSIEIDPEASQATVNGESLPFELTRQNNGRVLFRTGTKLYKIDTITIDGNLVSFTINGSAIEVSVKNEQALLLEKLGFTTSSENSEGQLNAPMPGKILELLVEEGDEVNLGQPLMILEAMKMENELKAPADGTITSLYVHAGDSVEKNQNLLEITIRG